MAKTNYYITWRSREICLAMELTEDTRLPMETPLQVDGTVNDVESRLFEAFATGDYEIRQNGRVFGRTKTDHEERFQRAVARGKGGSE